jgi:hypothetical protein
MAETIIFEDHLESSDTVLVYRDEAGDYYLGHAFFYNGRDSKYLLFMYKEALPLTNKDLMAAWNYLDDNSVSITIVNEPSNQVAVEDFLYSHGLERSWKSIQYRSVRDYMQLGQDFMNSKIEKGTAIGYIITK